MVSCNYYDAPSDEDVAIEVEYVQQADESYFDSYSDESDSVYSYSRSDMDSSDYDRV